MVKLGNQPIKDGGKPNTSTGKGMLAKWNSWPLQEKLKKNGLQNWCFTLLRCIMFEIHHSDASNRLYLWEMASSLLSGQHMKRISAYIVLIQTTTWHGICDDTKKCVYHAQLLIVWNIIPWKCFNQRFFNKLNPYPLQKKTKNFPMLPTNNLSIVTLKQLSLLMLDPQKKTPQKATKTPLRSNRVHDWLQTTPGNESINPTLLFKRKQKVTSSQSQPTNC